MIGKMFAAVTLLAVSALGAFPAAAAGIGEKGPDFMLFGVDQRYHSLDMYRERKAIVLIFSCNHCPAVVASEERMIELAARYQPQGVQFLAINANPADKVSADGFPQMAERAREKGFPFPYLYDETQMVSRAYGATRTPHAFVLGPERTIVYRGAIDNRHREPVYLADALDALLEGRPIDPAQTREFGCTIKYRTEAEAEKRFNR